MSIEEKDIDFSTIERFLELLTGTCDPNVCWRFLPDSPRAKEDNHEFVKRNFEGRLSDVRDDIIDYQLQENGIFVIVNAGGHKREAINKIRALFIDCDNRPQPDAWHVPPDFLVVRSPTHWHAYWRVEQCPLDLFTSAQRRLIAHYNSDPAIHDLPRVMRVPGTIHLKEPGDPVPVHLTILRESWEPIRPLKEILDGLPELATSQTHTGTSEKPTTTTRLVKQLARLDPGVGYGEWRDIVAAIRATNLSDGTEDDLRQIANDWSSGSYWAGAAPAKYTGMEAVDRVLSTMGPREGGLGYGSIVRAARKAGLSLAEETFGSDAPDMSNVVVLAERRAASKSRFKRIHELQDPPPMLIPGILLEGETLCIYGPPKHGKTFTALDIGLSLSTGAPVFGRFKPLRSGPVLYLSGEGNAGMRSRVQAWSKARGIAIGTAPFFLCETVPLTSNGTDGLKEYVDDGLTILTGVKPALIVVDTMARSMLGLNENDTKEVQKFVDLVDGLRTAFSCAVLVVAHSGKDASRGLRGSTAGPAGFDGLFSVEQGEAGLVRIEGRGFRYTEDRGPFNCRLDRHGESAALTSTDTEFHPRNGKKAKEQEEARSQRDELVDIMEYFDVRGDKMCTRIEMAKLVSQFRTGQTEGREFEIATRQADVQLKNGKQRGKFAGLWKSDARPGGKAQDYFALPDTTELE